MAEARWKATHIHICKYMHSVRRKDWKVVINQYVCPTYSEHILKQLNGKYCRQLDAGSDYDSEAAIQSSPPVFHLHSIVKVADFTTLKKMATGEKELSLRSKLGPMVYHRVSAM